MRNSAVLPAVLAVLVVGAGFAAAVPAGATSAGANPADSVNADSAPADSVSASADAPRGAEARAPPDLPEQWRHTYGGAGDDIFADLVRTDDGGYLLVGWTGGEDRDGWVVKIDGEGEKQWEETFGGSGTDRFYGVAKTDDGYLLAGRTDRDGGERTDSSRASSDSSDGGANGWVVELGPDGELTDERTPDTGAFYALEPDDSGYLLAGWTHGDGREGWALKLDENRTTEWSETYATPEGYDRGVLRAIVPTDSGYYFAGKIEGDSDDGWALSVGPDGTERWQATAGGPSRDDVWAAASASPNGSADGGEGTDGSRASSDSSDGGFVLAGETESDSTGPRDGWLVKFGADGEQQWERRPGGDGLQWLDSAMRTDEGYLFTGSSNAESGSPDGYVLTTDAEGEVVSESYYGTGSWDKPWPAIRAHGGGYLLAGQTAGDGATDKDGWLVRIDAPNATETTMGGPATAEDTSTDDDSTEDAIQGETATATEDPSVGVPGFGVGGAIAALLALALVARLRAGRR